MARLSVRIAVMLCIMVLLSAAGSMVVTADEPEVTVQFDEASNSIDLALVTPGPGDHLLARWGILPWTATKHQIHLSATGETTSSVTISKSRDTIIGQSNEKVLTTDFPNSLEFENCVMTFDAETRWQPCTITLTVGAVLPDEYKGTIYFSPAGSEQEVLSLPATIKVREPLWKAVVVLIVGVMARYVLTRLAPYFSEETWAYAELDRELRNLPRQCFGKQWLREQANKAYSGAKAKEQLAICKVWLEVVRHECPKKLEELISAVKNKAKQDEFRVLRQTIYDELAADISAPNNGNPVSYAKTRLDALEEEVKEELAKDRDKRAVEELTKTARSSLVSWRIVRVLHLAAGALILVYLLYLGLTTVFNTDPTWGVGGIGDYAKLAVWGFGSEVITKPARDYIQQALGT